MTEKPDLFQKALAAYAMSLIETRALRGAVLGGGQLPQSYAEIAVAQMVIQVEDDEESYGR